MPAPTDLARGSHARGINMALNHGLNAWAKVSGLGLDGLWHVDQPDMDLKPSHGLASPPQIGDFYRLSFSSKVFHPGEAGFWCLWSPLSPALDGWDAGNISQIEEIRLVLSYAFAFERQGNETIARVRVADVIPVTALAKVAIADTGPAGALNELNLERCQAFQHDDYIYTDYNLESDIGAWGLFKKDELIVFGQWGFEEDTFWAGRAKLPLPVYADLLQAVARTERLIPKSSAPGR